MDINDKLSELGLTLPEPPKPGGLYEAVRVIGNIAYVAIQFPYLNGEMKYSGRLGEALTTSDGINAAELCAMNIFAQIDRHVGFERILGLNMIEAQMQTVDGWGDFPKVLDGASRLFLNVLGDAGRHARALYGVHRLPRNSPITITATFTLKNMD